ncbi:MAG TPA: histidine kinase dimerization/phospho-acceptor domain-containing protein, partial [Solirubrobacterales bacterium]|nr:histidine kinase dimerization/phospho-acceptor domain-containing protein [Solirubrobacterales bacterium]
MSSRWRRMGLRGRLALSIGAIVVLAFAVVFVAVRAQMANEASVIQREEGHEHGSPAAAGENGEEGPSISPISDAQSDVEKTFLAVGGATLVAALLAGYLLAARTASPLRHFAQTASEIDAGDLTPRLRSDPRDAAELRILADAFNHMLDRLDQAFAKQRQFVSDASHELRSPLTAIRGQLEVLARQEEPSAQEVGRVEAVALREIGRVERLVEDMLSLARLDEGVGPALR